MSSGCLSIIIWVWFGVVFTVCLITLLSCSPSLANHKQKRHQAIVDISEIAALHRELTQLVHLYESTGEDDFTSVDYQKNL